MRKAFCLHGMPCGACGRARCIFYCQFITEENLNREQEIWLSLYAMLLCVKGQALI